MEDFSVPRRFDNEQTPPIDVPVAGSRARTPALQPGHLPGSGRLARRLLLVLLLMSGLLTLTTSSLSIYIATRLVTQDPRKAITQTPAALGLAYRDVRFQSRGDHVTLSGWFIPGVRSDGQLTADRTIIMVHGHDGNRADPTVGILDISAALARHGFAVLAFDLRGEGESADALFSLGYFEQRDVLGAVDFLRDGSLPYLELGRPRKMGGGVSRWARLPCCSHQLKSQRFRLSSRMRPLRMRLRSWSVKSPRGADFLPS